MNKKIYTARGAKWSKRFAVGCNVSYTYSQNSDRRKLCVDGHFKGLIDHLSRLIHQGDTDRRGNPILLSPASLC